KITRAVGRILAGTQDCLYLGNLDAQRDWGFAGDYVDAMWRMLQAAEPDDYVIATGETHTVREFCELAFGQVDLPLTWEGSGVAEVGYDPAETPRVRIDARYFRPAEVDLLLGDPSKAKRELAWTPRIKFRELVAMMVQHDVADAAHKAAASRLSDRAAEPRLHG
ncbi:MAG: GDP-mannose 4,6-dehydratase, partial [Planctomycetaceae bacterium]|nr:GDP-mannose 4,6-dehydratase [Planctomycetaceae bacterium]